MKYYLLEPTYKKSVIEFTAFKRIDEEGNTIFLRKELGWRWGSFLISVPETEEEAYSFIHGQGYDNLFDWASDFGFTTWNRETGEETLDVDESNPEAGPDVVAMVTHQLMPQETDDFVDITEDYPDAEMIETWDGCWEHWTVESYQTEIPEEEQEAIIEEVEEVYSEEYEEGVENLGWEFIDTYFEMHCSPKLVPCDEHGTPLEEEN
jgi:hypothetical protein